MHGTGMSHSAAVTKHIQLSDWALAQGSGLNLAWARAHMLQVHVLGLR